MIRASALFLGLFTCSLAAAPAEARVIWRGDFETGDLAQWSRKQWVSADRLVVVADPVTQGRWALRAKVRSGDDPINASGNRNELVYAGDRPLEAERVYRWSTLWPSTFRSADTWQLFTQWHHEGANGSPPVELFTRKDRIYLRVDGVDVWSTPLVHAAWHDFVLRIVWSANPREGLVELWFDGVHVLPALRLATLFDDGGSVYLKQGLYRHESVGYDQTVFHDGMVVATSVADVRPPPEPPASPDEPSPDEPPPDEPAPDEPQSLVPDAAGEPAPLAPGEPTIVVMQAAGCTQAGDAGLLAGLAGLLVRRRRGRKPQ